MSGPDPEFLAEQARAAEERWQAARASADAILEGARERRRRELRPIVALLGLRGTARAIGVTPSTLLRDLRDGDG